MRLMIARTRAVCNRKETFLIGAKHKSQSVLKTKANAGSVGQTADSRALRTRAKIDHAFVMLLHRRSFDSMRISDIAKKAGIGRATFYAHFTSKNDLLRSQLQRVVLPMLKVCPREPFLLDCRVFFEHIRTAPQFYTALMGGRERTGARVIREFFEEHLEAALTTTAVGIDNTIPPLMVKRFVISVLMGVAAHALHSGEITNGEEMQRRFQKLVGSGLGA